MQKTLISLALWSMTLQVLAEPAALLVYQVWEQGSDPYVSRVIVSADHLRLDEGVDGDGYTLFDRRQEMLYNVSLSERSVRVMQPPFSVPEPSESLILQEEIEVDEQAPAVGGIQPKNVRLLANGELCSELVVLQGVMQEAVEALAEFKLALARIQAQALDATPLSGRSACDLAAHVYAADRALRFGLPMHERSAGRSQSLVDFDADFDADSALFSLPEGFERRSMSFPGAI